MLTPLFCVFMLMLIVFVATEDDYLLKVNATKDVDGKGTHSTWLTCRRFRAGFPVTSFPFGLFLFAHICLNLHAQLHCSVSALPVRVFMVVCCSISALWWIGHSSVDDSTSRHFMLGPCRYSISLHLLVISAAFSSLEQVSEMANNIVTFHFPPDKCGVGTEKLFLVILFLTVKDKISEQNKKHQGLSKHCNTSLIKRCLKWVFNTMFEDFYVVSAMKW